MSIRHSQNGRMDAFAFDSGESPHEIYNAYSAGRTPLLVALAQLAAAGGYDEMLEILRNEHEHLLTRDVYDRVMELLVENAAAMKSSGRLEPLIPFFIDLIGRQKYPYQIFLACKAISELVVQNGRFPSRGCAIRYFKYASILFKRSGYFYNYINCIGVLDSLEEVQISESEFAFLKGCVSVRQEPACRELLCGLKPQDVGLIFNDKAFATAEFVEDPNWRKLIDAKESGAPIGVDLGFLSFLKKLNIVFEISDGMVHVGEYRPEGFATRVYNMAREYEVRRVRSGPAAPMDVENTAVEERPVAEEEERVAVGSSTGVVMDRGKAKAVPEFSDRFRIPHKKFRWYYSHSENRFVDGLLEERNRNRLEAFERASVAHEEKKRAFSAKEAVIDELAAQIQAMLALKYEQERLEAAERERLEEERRRAEQEALMWKNTRKIAKAGPPLPAEAKWGRGVDRAAVHSPAQAAADGLYVPPVFTDIVQGQPRAAPTETRWGRSASSTGTDSLASAGSSTSLMPPAKAAWSRGATANTPETRAAPTESKWARGADAGEKIDGVYRPLHLKNRQSESSTSIDEPDNK